MDVRKEIIRPGTYTYETPSGGFERMTVTADTIRHFHDQGKAMLAANLAIPVPLEHQADAKVMTADEKAAKQLLNNAGFVKDYEIKDGRLVGVLDIPDADIRKKLPTTIRSVSPWINSFTDGNGKKWDGVISHVALTTRPRIAKQANFETIALALNSVKADKLLIPADVKSAGVSLSSAGFLNKKGLPKFPIAFSLMTGVKLGLPEMDDDEDDDDDLEAGEENDGKKAKPKDSADPVDKFSGGDTSDAGEPESPGDVSFEELIPHLLEMLGVKVSAGSKDEEFLKMLVRDLLREVKALGKENEAKEDTSVLGNPGDKMGQKQPGPVVQESPPMYMSLTKDQVDAIADPKEKQIASAFFSQQCELNSLRKNKLDEAGVIRQARVDRLLKRIPPAAKPKLIAELAKEGAKLSLDNGVVVDPLTPYLDLLESSIPDLPALLVNGVKFAQEQPQPSDGELTSEQLDKIADGLVPKPKEHQAA